MCCGRERLSWLDEKFESWLQRNGPLGSKDLYASGQRRTRGTALLMLAGAVACLATFVPVDQKVELPQKFMTGDVGSAVARK